MKAEYLLTDAPECASTPDLVARKTTILEAACISELVVYMFLGVGSGAATHSDRDYKLACFAHVRRSSHRLCTSCLVAPYVRPSQSINDV